MRTVDRDGWSADTIADGDAGHVRKKIVRGDGLLRWREHVRGVLLQIRRYGGYGSN